MLRLPVPRHGRGWRTRRGSVLVPALVAVALFTSACVAGADMTGTVSSRMQAWEKATGVARTSAVLLEDAGRVAKLGRGRDPTALQTACLVLSNDAQAANSVLPTPDHVATVDLNDAYLDYYSVAVDCYMDAGDAARKASLDRALRLLKSADAHLAAAGRRMAAVASSVPRSSVPRALPGGVFRETS